MMNIIKADVYRILRGKALYITFAVMLGFLALLVFSTTDVQVGISNTTLEEYKDTQSFIDGASSAIMMFSNSNSLFYFALPLTIAVTVAMFSSGAAKNSISTGMSRIKIYFAKWVLSSLFCAAVLFLFAGLGVLIITIMKGAGDWSGGHAAYIFKIYGLQMLVLLAANSILVFLSFVTRNSGAVTGLYIAVMFVPQIVLLLLSVRFPAIEKIAAYDVTNMINSFAMLETLSASEVANRTLVCAGIIIVTSAAGITLFKKAEIK